jgi:hypothetical protein
MAQLTDLFEENAAPHIYIRDFIRAAARCQSMLNIQALGSPGMRTQVLLIAVLVFMLVVSAACDSGVRKCAFLGTFSFNAVHDSAPPPGICHTVCHSCFPVQNSTAPSSDGTCVCTIFVCLLFSTPTPKQNIAFSTLPAQLLLPSVHKVDGSLLVRSASACPQTHSRLHANDAPQDNMASWNVYRPLYNDSTGMMG